MKKKTAHFFREPLKVFRPYTSKELNTPFDVEDDYQRELIRCLYCYAHPDELLEICAIPGGSARTSIATAMKLKNNGVRAGVYDLMLLWRNRNIAFIECKATKGKPSPAQEEFSQYLTSSGHRGRVCKTLQEALDFVVTCGLRLL